jgi:CPA2 family monovalent cation:H+ antiporter-2
VALPSLLLDFALVLIAAEVGGTLFRYLRMPRVVGMLVAGIALGPFTPGYVVVSADIQDLALLGAVFLMFSSGLAFDIRGFRALGAWPFLLAGLGVVFSFVAGLGLGALAGFSVLESVFIGLILTSTSTALGLKFLADSGLGERKGADLLTAAILIDDIIALSLMTAAVGVAGPSPVPLPFLVAGLLGILGLAALLVFISTHALPRILRATEVVSPSSIVMVAVSFALLISFAFAVLGLPPLVGAFFAGSIVASTEYGARVTRHIAPVTAIFMAVFFASIGLLINPATIPGVLLLGGILVVAAVVAKAVPAVAVLRRAAGLGATAAVSLAIVLIPRAEISLIIAQYGVSIGGTPDLLAIAMFVMIATALLPGALLSLGTRWRAVARPPPADVSDPPSPPSSGPPK